MAWTRADVKVGFACNNCCVFCAQGHKREGCPQVPLDELVGRMKQGRDTSEELVLTGGEPSMHPEIVELVRAAKGMGYKQIQLQTNGRRLAYAPFLDALVEAGVSEFSPALHGHTAEIHDALTRAPGSFRQTVAGIQAVSKRGLPIVTNSVVVQRNVRHLHLLIALLGKLGVGQAQLAFVHPVGTAYELFDQVVPKLSDIVEPIRVCKGVADQCGMRLVTEAVPLCFLSGMWDLAVEHQIPDTTVIDLDGVPFDYSSWRPVEGKMHGPPCEACAVRGRCEGPWREYPEKLGWTEFHSVGG